MARVTLEEVRALLPAGVDLSDAQIEAAITSAACTVEGLEEYCPGLSETCLTQIELYLSAHYSAAMDPTLNITSEKDGCCGGSATYGFKLGDGVLGTPYGQMANTLSRGCLAELDKRPARFFSIGSC